MNLTDICPKCLHYRIVNDGMNGLYYCPNPDCDWEEPIDVDGE